jgi:orotate phosphoribosyltransferase-like protein
MAKEIIGASEDHRWLVSQNLAPYKGKWIAIARKSIVASGVSLKAVLEEARKKGVKPLCIQVPEGYITA